tara:strand:- start:9914 stop:10468 length:555 start_codon:yes stop_codon:yes gene_type:complete
MNKSPSMTNKQKETIIEGFNRIMDTIEGRGLSAFPEIDRLNLYRHEKLGTLRLHELCHIAKRISPELICTIDHRTYGFKIWVKEGLQELGYVKETGERYEKKMTVLRRIYRASSERSVHSCGSDYMGDLLAQLKLGWATIETFHARLGSTRKEVIRSLRKLNEYEDVEVELGFHSVTTGIFSND